MSNPLKDIFFLFVFVFLITTISLAVDSDINRLTSYKETITYEPQGFTHHVINITLENHLPHNLNSIKLTVPKELYNFSVTSPSYSQVLNYSFLTENNVPILKISFSSPLKPNIKENFLLTYNSRSFVYFNSNDDSYIFSMRKKLSKQIKKAEFSFILPMGYVLLFDQEKSRNLKENLISDGKIKSDGKKIYVDWIYKDISTETLFSFFISFEKAIYDTPLSDIVEISVLKTNYPLILIFLIIGLLIGYFIAFYLFHKQNKIKTLLPPQYKDVSPIESKFIDYLIEQKGSAYQHDALEHLNVSKSKMSRLITALVEKNIVTKEKRGKINKITLIMQKEETTPVTLFTPQNAFVVILFILLLLVSFSYFYEEKISPEFQNMISKRADQNFLVNIYYSNSVHYSDVEYVLRREGATIISANRDVQVVQVAIQASKIPHISKLSWVKKIELT